MYPRCRSTALLPLSAFLACTPPEQGPPVRSARGNEPFWAISMDGREALVRTPDLPDGHAYKDGVWKRQEGGAGGWVFKARRKTAEGLWLTLEITAEPCTNSMSGAESPFRAVITFDNKRMEGCAS